MLNSSPAPHCTAPSHCTLLQCPAPWNCPPSPAPAPAPAAPLPWSPDRCLLLCFPRSARPRPLLQPNILNVSITAESCLILTGPPGPHRCVWLLDQHGPAGRAGCPAGLMDVFRPDMKGFLSNNSLESKAMLWVFSSFQPRCFWSRLPPTRFPVV